ncbi:MAG: hypothetical protein COW85_05395 [Ignavibacteria bacterium CG22_combo_CG10-13_8_21_14_all_37_15]|nr:MAG: hypothetical protein COW85_05395 [Ignavibacteria bacterium CG22_combo_CG10-13_8_21_14_all_37_15]
MKRVAIISVILIPLLMMSCKKENPVVPEPVKLEPLFPLSLGNYWIYRGYELNADGTGGRPSLWKLGFIIDDTVTQVINGESILNYKLFICDSTLKPSYDKPGNFEGSKLVYQNGNGFYYAGTEKYDTVKMSFNDLIFPYTPKKDESLTWHYFYYSNVGNLFNIPDDAVTQYKCVSTDSLLTTPLGDFRCAVYKMVILDFEPLFRDEVYYFIKPGIGIVGMVDMVYYYSRNEYRYVRKTLLTDYKIEKGK